MKYVVAMPALCWGQTPLPAVDVLKIDIDAVTAAPEGGADRQIKVVNVGKLNVGVGVLQMAARPNDGKPITGIAHSLVTERRRSVGLENLPRPWARIT